MFDTSNIRNTNETKIEQVSGSLAKTQSNSFFLQFHCQSGWSHTLFSEEPYFENNNRKRIYVDVLQVMMTFDKYYLCEVVKKRELK